MKHINQKMSHVCSKCCNLKLSALRASIFSPSRLRPDGWHLVSARSDMIGLTYNLASI